MFFLLVSIKHTQTECKNKGIKREKVQTMKLCIGLSDCLKFKQELGLKFVLIPTKIRKIWKYIHMDLKICLEIKPPRLLGLLKGSLFTLGVIHSAVMVGESWSEHNGAITLLVYLLMSTE